MVIVMSALRIGVIRMKNKEKFVTEIVMVIVLLLTRIQARLNHVAILRAVIVYLMIVIIAIVIAIGQEENGLNRSMLNFR